MPRTIDNEDLALYLASRSPTAKPTKPAGKLLDHFSASSLTKALVDGRKAVNMAWVIQHYLNILYDTNTRSADKIMVLDRLQALVRLGAIQDAGFAKSLSKTLKSRTAQHDPMAGETAPTLRVVMGGS